MTMADAAASSSLDVLRPVRVWDLPTRLFHWVLAATIAGSVISAKIGGNAMQWHFRFGYLVATLLAFRLLWGFVGGHWSRFARFFPTPSRLARYLRGAPHIDDHFEVGHSPLGALSVFAMLGLLTVQVCSGVVTDDDAGNTGPLIALVSEATSRLATGWHKTGGQWLILLMIALHVAAIAVYRIRYRRDLVGPMLRGDKPLPARVQASADSLATRLFAAVLAAACAAAVTWVVGRG